MRFVDHTGRVAPGRRQRALASTLQQEDVLDAQRLTEVLRSALQRISDLESGAAPSAIEFEVDLNSTGTVMEHGFGCPVRWWITSWRTSSAGAMVRELTTSTLNSLVLASDIDGQAVVRIEPSQFGIRKAVSV